MEQNWVEGKAIYVQIMDMICSDIASGKLKPGQKMDSVREYAVKYSVNPNTMQRALHELERDGVIFSKRSIGRFVTEDVERISAMRKEHAEAAAQEFCERMKELGYTGEEAADFFHKIADKEFPLDAMKIG